MEIELLNLLEKFLEERCTEEELLAIKKLLDTDEGKHALAEAMLHKDKIAEESDQDDNEEKLYEMMQNWKKQVFQRISENETSRITK